MKSAKYKDEEVTAYRYYEKNNMARWLTNKMFKCVVPMKNWTWIRYNDFRVISRVMWQCDYIAIMTKKPVGGKIYAMGHSFKAYKIYLDNEKFSGWDIESCMVFVPYPVATD